MGTVDLEMRAMRPELVLVTGAGGFVGRHLCASLLERGALVRGLVRHGAAPTGVEEARAADLTDRDAVRGAMQGVDTVLHLAARVHQMDERSPDRAAAYRRTNVEGTRVVLEEAIAAGVRRFVFFSSVKAVGEGADRPWTEESPAHPTDPYGESKLEAERLVREVAGAAGLHAPVLRLPLVYGPGVNANMLSLFRLVDRGVPLPLRSLRNRRSLLYVGNLAAAVRAVLEAPAAGTETFFVSDGHDLSTPELVRAIAEALGRPARLLPVPAAVFRAAGRVGDLVGRARRVPLSSAAVDRLMGSLSVDTAKLRRMAGYVPPFSVPDGLRETARWYRAQTAEARA
jgi:nucleoside-diphosphate-sugar epimerase